MNIIPSIFRLTALRKAAAAACLALVSLLLATQTYALPTDLYAANSCLAQGRWVKISVSETGLYKISKATLASWGFKDPAKVRIHGYGATRRPDVIAASTYVDDLPVVQSVLTASGDMVFWGEGPLTWSASINGKFTGTYNIYTNYGYYFVGESDTEIPEIPVTKGPEINGSPATTFMDRLHHEQDIVTAGEAGPYLLGEDFRYTPSRKFSFKMPGRVSGSPVWFECSFVAHTIDITSQLTFTANGTPVPHVSNDRIPSTTNDSHYHGSSTTTRHTLNDISGENLDLTIAHSASGIISGAWLNYISVNYERALVLPSDGVLKFWTGNNAILANADETTRIWDVTSPLSIREMETTAAEGGRQWTNAYSLNRSYVAWKPDAKLNSVKYEGTVTNQNLHADQSADMVIFTHRQWAAQAERIAEMHRAEGLTVLVRNAEEVYNEFGSGSADVGALRMYLKMLYDRGNEAGKPLRYALLLGRATYDNRHNTQGMANAAPTLPCWLGGTLSQSLSDNDGFGTDDVLAMLDDNSGGDRGLDNLSIAVGRLPFTSASGAESYVDKLEAYVRKPKMTGWKNRIMLLADDQDRGEHMTQTESFCRNLLSNSNQHYLLNKVYMDAYENIGGQYPGAREDMFRLLDEGTAIWTFVGHANNHSMTHDKQLTYNDINTMFLKTPPILYAATCDFLRWDSTTQSGGEILTFERYGGTIAMISATRPVYIYDNGLFTNAMGRAVGKRDENGSYYRLGDIYRNAKNDICVVTESGENRRVSNLNRLRYVLMADPAMRMPIPDNVVTLDAVNDIPLDPENPPMVSAREHVTFSGSIVDGNGQPVNDFNGTVTMTLYDAEQSTTSHGNGKEGAPVTFDHHGDRLVASSAKVVNGRYAMRVGMPSEIAENYRPATLTMYAVSDDNTKEAAGISSDLYVYGIDEEQAPDTIPPVIDSFYLNHSSFTDGGLVNDSPMAIATVSDDIAINLSTSGIGHQPRLLLDGNRSYIDVTQYYTPNPDGTPGGTINYPFENLTEGSHTLQLRVWDTDGNATTSELTFMVSKSVAPKIFDIRTDANPASTHANFYIVHDRPDQMATVTVTVYNLLGAPIWSKTVSGISDMFESTPVTWDLTDGAGHRVNRGIYLYRAAITCDNETYDTGSRRIAVTN